MQVCSISVWTGEEEDRRRGGEEHAVSSLGGIDSTVQIVVRETYSLTTWSIECQELLVGLLLRVLNSHQSGRMSEQVQEFFEAKH